MTSNFIHLRATTPYSMLNGAITPKQLLKLARKNNMPAIGIADKNSLAAALKFSTHAVKENTQPVIGANIQISAEWKQSDGELILYAKNETGFQNLTTLVSQASLAPQNPDTAPNLSLETIREKNEGLICLTAGTSGALANTLSRHSPDAADTLVRKLHDIFRDRLYIEIQRHGDPHEQNTETTLLELALVNDIAVVATNDILFADENFHHAHSVLRCVEKNQNINDKDRSHSNPNWRFRSAEEMTNLFADLPEATANSVVIAQRCSFFPTGQKPTLPAFLPDGQLKEENAELARQAELGLKQRTEHATYAPLARYQERLRYELGVIETTQYAGYFLIVSDFVRWARAQGIPVGPGRGSGAGSVVSWSLGITDLDPLRWGLVFERFLNPDRISMPDFDIDFCQERRGEVLEYVREKYGEERVAHIGTYGTLQSRGALRDVGRVLGVPYRVVDRMCRLVPDLVPQENDDDSDEDKLKGLAALARDAAMQDFVNEEASAGEVLRLAIQIEGLYRHASTHAAGVVISRDRLQERVPLFKDPRAMMPATQYDMKWVEEAGLVKFDFLGLNTLTILEDASKMIRRERSDFKIEEVALDDDETYDMLCRGDTIGVFQMGSSGMREVAVKACPRRLEDIIALVALYRPGPMQNIDDYVAQKNGAQEIRYLHEGLEPILRETYGIIVYQEQVMEIARTLAGYTLAQADVLRKAMGKKEVGEMRRQRSRFVEGAREHGLSEKVAGALFVLIERFAEYGFNKAHAASYAMLAYWTAYMKTHYPGEYFAALMTHEMRDVNRIGLYVQELRNRGISLLSPDVNTSEAGFSSVRGEGGVSVRYGLAAVRNFGVAAAEAVVAERRRGGVYASVEDMAGRLGSGVVNRRGFEVLAASGAFDGVVAHRRLAYEAAGDLARGGEGGTMFDFGAGAAETAPAPGGEKWSLEEKLRYEFEALGLYLSDHPLSGVWDGLVRRGVMALDEVARILPEDCERRELPNGQVRRERAVCLAGSVVRVARRRDRRGRVYAHVRLSDPSGLCDVTLFSRAYEEGRGELEEGRDIVVDGYAEPPSASEGARVSVTRVVGLRDFLGGARLRRLRVSVGAGGVDGLLGVLGRSNGGGGVVEVVCRGEGGGVVIELGGRWELDEVMVGELGRVDGVSVLGSN
ncbi:MAG: DNA polymerase III subunit alpha [Alphaproteobacteria bacterium]|nr:DNA polymerase III subunit alpha [Alphaproteobacteria bacterium]MDA8004771.1 DNA polymerase III subunit alpha [Alphaproteobacteria bacterium]MDA8006520.1 DNA polymerase III subunit alpha [Alphaproteobacteria bacterium]MDA8013887.1 DNA polymerase III subunit alpha [Alphaproteobacteria bacterium]